MILGSQTDSRVHMGTRFLSGHNPLELKSVSKAGLAKRLYRQRLRQNPQMYQKYLEKQRLYVKRWYEKKKQGREKGHFS